METRPLHTPENPWSIVDAQVLGAKSVIDEIQVTKKILSMSPIVVQRIYFIYAKHLNWYSMIFCVFLKKQPLFLNLALMSATCEQNL